MIDVRKAAEKIGELGMLPFFPADKAARTGIVGLVCEMAATNDQIDFLVRRALQTWDKWEGPHELRALFCNRFRPADGIEADSRLPQFAEGYPPVTEHGKGLIVGKQECFLLPGEIATSEQAAVALIDEALARKAALNRAQSATDEEIDRIKAHQDSRRRESQRMV